MTKLAREKMPLVFGFLGGKDQFNQVYKKLFGRLPKVVEAALPVSRKIK
jgi:hypothetical protein